MSMHKRNLLVIAALFSVAPLSAHERRAVSSDDPASDCQYERAAARADQTTVAIETSAAEGPLLGGGRSSAAFLP
jgi:hypothetical protein